MIRYDLIWLDFMGPYIPHYPIIINQYQSIYSDIIVGRLCWCVGAHGKGLTMDDFKQLPESERQELEGAWQADSDGFDGCFPATADPDRTGQTWKNSEAEKLRQEEERRKEEEQRLSKLTSNDFKANERVYEHKTPLMSIVHVAGRGSTETKGRGSSAKSTGKRGRMETCARSSTFALGWRHFACWVLSGPWSLCKQSGLHPRKKTTGDCSQQDLEKMAASCGVVKKIQATHILSHAITNCVRIEFNLPSQWFVSKPRMTCALTRSWGCHL